MTIEIRELVIEARVLNDRRGAPAPLLAANREDSIEQERLIETIVRRVLDRLHEEREPWE